MFSATWVLTLKARSMPRFSHSFHPSLPATNRPLAHGTFNAKQFLIILFTIWFPSIDIEALRTDLLATVTADKVFRMERLAHGLNARPSYGLLARVTVRSKVLIVVIFTVKFSSLLNEALVL